MNYCEGDTGLLNIYDTIEHCLRFVVVKLIILYAISNAQAYTSGSIFLNQYILRCQPPPMFYSKLFLMGEEIRKNRTLCDRNLKFGAMIEYDKTNILRYRAIAGLSFKQYGCHFSK